MNNEQGTQNDDPPAGGSIFNIPCPSGQAGIFDIFIKHP
jgi:hypothetical protein